MGLILPLFLLKRLSNTFVYGVNMFKEFVDEHIDRSVEINKKLDEFHERMMTSLDKIQDPELVQYLVTKEEYDFNMFKLIRNDISTIHKMLDVLLKEEKLEPIDEGAV